MFSRLAFISLLGTATLVSAVPSHSHRNVPDSGLVQRQNLAEVISSCTEPKTVALTFDDSPYIYEKDLVNILNGKGAKATFYVNGQNYRCIYDDDMIDALRFAYDSGHSIQSHTWAHMDLAQQSADTVREQMERVDIALERILGVTPAWVRPPFGSYNDVVREVAASRGQNIVMWDFDSRDSMGASAEESKQAYANRISENPGNVLTLNHETYDSTVYDVIPYAIDQFLANGYRLVTVGECLGGRPEYQNVFQRSEKDGSWVC